MKQLLLRLGLAIALVSTCLKVIEAEAQEPLLDLGSRVQAHEVSNRFSLPAITSGAVRRFKERMASSISFILDGPPSLVSTRVGLCIQRLLTQLLNTPRGPIGISMSPSKKRGNDPATGKKFWDADVTHNPNVLFHSGKYYLFYTGQHGDGEKLSDASQQPAHRCRCRYGSAGPWRRFDKPIIDVSEDRDSFDSLCVTNPAACVRPDGSVLVIYKAVKWVEGKAMGGNVRYGAAVADEPEGPYRKIPGHIFEREQSGQTWMLAEDPFIWFSSKYGNRYYAIARDVVGAFTGSRGGICIFESSDGLDWRESEKPKLIDNRFRRSDGTLSETQLERPALLIVNDEPIYLFGATDGYLKEKASSNVQIELRLP